MVRGRLHVDPRLRRELGQLGELLVGEVVVEAAPLRERADADRVAVRGDDGHGLADVLGRDAVHRDAGPRLEPVDGHLGRDHERAAAETDHRGLKRRERPQRRVEKQERQHAALERSRLRCRVETAREREQVLDLVDRVLGQIVEAVHGL